MWGLTFETLLTWFLAPVDPSRGHMVDFYAAWHGRLMVMAWGILFPVSILITRFMKIRPKQRWPQELDSHFWFYFHVTVQLMGGAMIAVAVYLMWSSESSGWMAWLHRTAGWAVVTLYCVQVFGGAVRGTKGGPSEREKRGSLHGDHYDMTRRRVMFEYLHKFFGYVALALAFIAMLLGLWIANGFVWMWLGLVGWWAMAGIIYAYCQRRGMALDTYQAIWGPDPALPGNQRKPIGIGVHRRGPNNESWGA
ncbi:MAG: cytochrome b561 domain-containing protein [Pseudomonadota bacterium]